MRNIKLSKSKANQAMLEENDDKKRFVLLLELLLGSLSWHLGISYDFSSFPDFLLSLWNRYRNYLEISLIQVLFVPCS